MSTVGKRMGFWVKTMTIIPMEKATAMPPKIRRRRTIRNNQTSMFGSAE